ncbi:SidA/IucD/PvdA family monooxygenase [Bradyrhizobium sp.]|uniref:SidA/IucD/PvdA family monooxygenase n=1 Tax=Bradyrhizobium sp. TaxID=376 RepID=UPI003C55A76E
MLATTDTDSDLRQLERRVRFELDCLGYPTRPWVVPRSRNGTAVHDVIIVGGGQSGIAIAFRLLRERISNVRVLDRNPPDLAGPWRRFARMHTLRTPKNVTGPDLGIPSLSARAWWQARFGESSWQQLGKIPRERWHDYLLWVKNTIGIASSEAEVTDIEPLDDGLLAVHATKGDGTAERYLTRNVVLATGIEGSGHWFVPSMIADALPRHAYAHTADAIDFTALRGKTVAVIGAGASAFDNAAMALESGAASVDLLARRRQLPTINPNRWMEFAGFLRHFGDLDDARKWRFMQLIFEMNQPPPQDTFDRCSRHANFLMRLGCPLQGVDFVDGRILLTHPQGPGAFDFLIAGTGFAVDLATRPELARFHDRIARWSDLYQPPAGEQHAALGAYPYLSPSFQFTAKAPGSAPYLANIFSYTFAAMPSLACSAGISALKFGVERIVTGISRGLFVEDADVHLQSLRDYAERELDVTALTTRGN